MDIGGDNALREGLTSTVVGMGPQVFSGLTLVHRGDPADWKEEFRRRLQGIEEFQTLAHAELLEAHQELLAHLREIERPWYEKLWLWLKARFHAV